MGRQRRELVDGQRRGRTESRAYRQRACDGKAEFFTFNYLELNKLKIFKWKLIHFILPYKELLKQWRIVNDSDCLVCKKKENYKHFYFDCKYNKKYWQEVKKMTTNLYIGDHVFNLESLVFGY